MLGSLPEKDRAQLVARAKKDYENMSRTEYDRPDLIKRGS
jgi:hypothetical protein